MHKTMLAMVLFLGALPALAACGGAGDGSADPTADTTSAATLSESATLSGVGTFAIDSAVFHATIRGTTGAWTSRLLEDQSRLLQDSVEIDLPGRSYVLSGVQVVSSQASSGQGETIWTFVLAFGSLSVPSTPAVAGAPSTWVTIRGVEPCLVESAQLQATITAPTGSWVPALLKDVSNFRSIASAQLALQSPARTYTLSPAYPTGATTGAETTFTLIFTEASVQIPIVTLHF